MRKRRTLNIDKGSFNFLMERMDKKYSYEEYTLLKEEKLLLVEGVRFTAILDAITALRKIDIERLMKNLNLTELEVKALLNDIDNVFRSPLDNMDTIKKLRDPLQRAHIEKLLKIVSPAKSYKAIGGMENMLDLMDSYRISKNVGAGSYNIFTNFIRKNPHLTVKEVQEVMKDLITDADLKQMMVDGGDISDFKTLDQTGAPLKLDNTTIDDIVMSKLRYDVSLSKAQRIKVKKARNIWRRMKEGDALYHPDNIDMSQITKNQIGPDDIVIFTTGGELRVIKLVDNSGNKIPFSQSDLDAIGKTGDIIVKGDTNIGKYFWDPMKSVWRWYWDALEFDIYKDMETIDIHGQKGTRKVRRIGPRIWSGYFRGVKIMAPFQAGKIILRCVLGIGVDPEFWKEREITVGDDDEGNPIKKTVSYSVKDCIFGLADTGVGAFGEGKTPPGLEYGFWPAWGSWIKMGIDAYEVVSDITGWCITCDEQTAISGDLYKLKNDIFGRLFKDLSLKGLLDKKCDNAAWADAKIEFANSDVFGWFAGWQHMLSKTVPFFGGLEMDEEQLLELIEQYAISEEWVKQNWDKNKPGDSPYWDDSMKDMTALKAWFIMQCKEKRDKLIKAKLGTMAKNQCTALKEYTEIVVSDKCEGTIDELYSYLERAGVPTPTGKGVLADKKWCKSNTSSIQSQIDLIGYLLKESGEEGCDGYELSASCVKYLAGGEINSQGTCGSGNIVVYETDKNGAPLNDCKCIKDPKGSITIIDEDDFTVDIGFETDCKYNFCIFFGSGVGVIWDDFWERMIYTAEKNGFDDEEYTEWVFVLPDGDIKKFANKSDTTQYLLSIPQGERNEILKNAKYIPSYKLTDKFIDDIGNAEVEDWGEQWCPSTTTRTECIKELKRWIKEKFKKSF